MRVLLVAAGLASLSAAPFAQRAPLQPVAHTVHVDVLAVDAGNRPVTTLKASDFELQEDGQMRAIDEARFVHVDPARGSDAPQPVTSRSEELQEARRADARLFAVFVDEYHISPGNLEATRQALTDLVDRQMGPRDLLVVMKPLESLLTIRLTHDRDGARAMIAGLDARKGDYTPKTAYERTAWAGTPARTESARTQVVVSALNALAVHLGSLGDGRKTLFVVTEGLQTASKRRGQEYLATIDTIIRSANRSHVSIYPIVLPGAAGSPAPVGAGAAAASDDEQAALHRLADETNGKMIGAADGIDVGVRGAVADASGYYLLTYRGSHKEDGGFHPLTVRTTRPGIVLRMRAGYVAPSIEDRLIADMLARASAPLPPIKLEPPRHLSPFIQPWFGLSRGANGKTRVAFVWEPAGRVPGDRSPRSAARVNLTALAGDDSIIFQGEVLPTGAGEIGDPSGTPMEVAFDVPPGRLRLRMQVQDMALQPLDSDVRDIAVREFSKGLAIATPEIMRTRNAREFRQLDDDAAAVPVSSRQFSRTERLIIRFATYAPTGQSAAVSARLLNRGGQSMRTLDLEDGPDGLHQCDLPLAALAPGEYQIELAATAAGTQAKEVVDIRVTN